MFFSVFRSLSALVLMFAAFPVLADDVALVIGNRNYQHGDRMYDAERALRTTRPLRESGFSVVSGRDLKLAETQKALAELVRKMDGGGRVLILLNGHFVRSATDTWFVPVDVDRPDLATINFQAISMRNLLEIVGQRPGGATVFLGTFARDFDVGIGLDGGIGPFDVPQGVFVGIGKPDDIVGAVRQQFLEPGLGLAAALAASADIEGYGYISDFSSVVPEEEDTPPDVSSDDLLEQAYWQIAIGGNTVESYRNYLDRYPNGRHAIEAQARVNGILGDPAEDTAETAEKELGLRRSERRKIQENLTLLGFNTRGIDGIFGRGTRRAVESWQSQFGFDPTGYLTRGQINRLAIQARRRSDELAEQERIKKQQEEAADAAFWQDTGAYGTEDDLLVYLNRYPNGLYSNVARDMLAQIEEDKKLNAAADDKDAWDVAVATDTVASYELYIQQQPTGAFLGDAQARLTEILNQEATAAEIEQAKQEEAGMGMNIVARILVERRLNQLGLNSGGEDGIFNQKTRNALRQFQRDRGFPVTGYVTHQTLDRMIQGAVQ